MSSTNRVVVVGARRKRQGTGPFVARTFETSGAQVCGIVGTSEESIQRARSDLKSEFGIDCNGYTDIVQAVDEEQPDILAVCSPFQFHLDALELAAKRRIHCLCEKPLFWSSAPDLLEKTKDVLNAFKEQKCFLQTITQWPYTLPYYYKIYPEEMNSEVRKFEMFLSPRDERNEMIQDSVPHLLSMLDALVGPGEIVDCAIERYEDSTKRWQLSFRYINDNSNVETTMFISPVPQPPRPAAYGINGKTVHRNIELPAYSFTFSGIGKRIPVDDPLELLIADFLNSVRHRRQLNRESLYCGMAGLSTLTTAMQSKIDAIIADNDSTQDAPKG